MLGHGLGTDLQAENQRLIQTQVHHTGTEQLSGLIDERTWFCFLNCTSLLPFLNTLLHVVHNREHKLNTIKPYTYKSSRSRKSIDIQQTAPPGQHSPGSQRSSLSKSAHTVVADTNK